MNNQWERFKGNSTVRFVWTLAIIITDPTTLNKLFCDKRLKMYPCFIYICLIKTVYSFCQWLWTLFGVGMYFFKVRWGNLLILRGENKTMALTIQKHYYLMYLLYHHSAWLLGCRVTEMDCLWLWSFKSLQADCIGWQLSAICSIRWRLHRSTIQQWNVLR